MTEVSHMSYRHAKPSRFVGFWSAHRLLRPLALCALVLVGIGGLGMTAASAATDTTAPGVPGSLKSAYYGQVGVSIGWGKVSASDTAGYRVYRSAAKTIVPAT